jgi:uncharacterized protein YbaP (TraB family)
MDTAVMKKTNEIARMLVSELIPKKIVDENAQTIEEIAKASGLSITSTKDQIKQFLFLNKIEKVWKQSGRNLVPAYRTL